MRGSQVRHTVVREEKGRRAILTNRSQSISCCLRFCGMGLRGWTQGKGVQRVMALYRVVDKSIIAPLFEGQHHAMIRSCLQDCMGDAYADNLVEPQSAAIYVGGFCYFAGKVNTELIATKPQGHVGRDVLMVPPDDDWQRGIEAVYGSRALPWIRYATKQDISAFDRRDREPRSSPPARTALIDQRLWHILALPWASSVATRQLRAICGQCLGCCHPPRRSWFRCFGVCLLQGRIEVEIDTREDYRRRGLLPCAERP